jgi:hypothetical protein
MIRVTDHGREFGRRTCVPVPLMNDLFVENVQAVVAVAAYSHRAGGR